MNDWSEDKEVFAGLFHMLMNWCSTLPETVRVYWSGLDMYAWESHMTSKQVCLHIPF